MGVSVPWGVVLGCALIAEVVGTVLRGAGFEVDVQRLPFSGRLAGYDDRSELLCCQGLSGPENPFSGFRVVLVEPLHGW